MADQTIEIKLILRDELTRQLQPVIRQVNQLQNARVDRFHGSMDRLGGAVRVVHRELSTLSRLTLGGLVGGGVIAGLAALTSSLQEMSRQAIQLRYTSQALGVSTKFFDNMKTALVGLGKSPEAAAASIKRSLETLDEFMVKGPKSSLGKFLEESKGGSSIARELKAIIAKEGNEAGQKFLINAAKQIIDRKGRAEFLRQAGLPYSAVDIDKILPELPERIELTDAQVDKMAIANMQLARHSENIKTILAGEMLPAITAITKSLSEYLQTEAGQKFSKQLGEIAGDISKAISTWIEEGGLEAALKTLETAFGAADKVIKGIGLTWPQAIAALVGIKFALWLADVALGLSAISKLVWVIRLLPFVAMYYGAKWFRDLVDAEGREQRALERHPGRLSDQPGLTEEQKKNLEDLQRSRPMIVPTPQKQSGEGKPQSEQEQRAAQAADELERDALNQQLALLRDETGHLADNLQIGGPEGTRGPSGFQFTPPTAIYPNLPARSSVVAGSPPSGVQYTPGSVYGNLSQAEGSQLPGGWRDLGDIYKTGPLRGQPLPQFTGAPRNVPGVSLPFRESAGRAGQQEGGWVRVVNPMTGESEYVRQVDIGPNMFNPASQNKGIDINAALAERWGYSSTGAQARATGRPVFPTGQKIEWQTASPEEVAWSSFPGDRGGGAGGWDEAGFSGITRSLAQQNAPLTGSATVDIDVGGLGQPARNPDELFRPQSLDGVVQMQNATQPQHNPLSFQ